MEGFLFLLDMVLLIVLLRAVIKTEELGKTYIDSGIFTFYQESETESKKREKHSNA